MGGHFLNRSSITETTESYLDAILETDQEEALQIIDRALKGNIPPEDLVFNVVLPTMDQLLHRVSGDDGASLSQHFFIAKVSSMVVDSLLGKFHSRPACSGSIVLGTASGDFHGLGKKILTGCLATHMYTIHDAGLNVSPKKFVDIAEEKHVLLPCWRKATRSR